MRPPRQLDAATIIPVADGVEDMTAIAATTSMPRQNRDWYGDQPFRPTSSEL